METRHIVLSLLAALILVLLVRDIFLTRRAGSVRMSWSCFHCGRDLGPLQSVLVRRPGVTVRGSYVRVCRPCNARHWRIQLLFIALLVLGVVALSLWRN